VNITYNILRGVEVPTVVNQSNKWRKLRQELNDAKTNETVLVHLKFSDYPDKETMQKATESARAGAYCFKSSAKLYKNRLDLKTTAINVADLPEDKISELGKYGVQRDDRLLAIKKVRDDTLPTTEISVVEG